MGDNSSSASDDTASSTMKRKPIGQSESITKRSRNNADDEMILTGVASVLDTLLMKQAQGESG